MSKPGEAEGLPELRQELQLRQGAASGSGEPTWLIYDPVRHRFIQINATACRLVALWTTCGTRDALIAAARDHYGLTVDSEQVAGLVRFLHAHHLTVLPAKDGWRSFAAEAGQRRHGPLVGLFHNYLFFRLPLCRPERFLRATLPLVRPLASRVALAVIGLLGCLGIYLVSRQWDAFIGTVAHTFTLEGAGVLLLALVVVKTLHELGHAYTAVHYRCAVPTMGVALFLLTPLLYTDVTDSWRLKDRRQRLAIDSAGVAVELAVALLATLAWSLLPDGPMRGAAFFLATAGWLMSLAINLNPLMRFDGYYLLADLIGVDNLQARAFSIGRWRLREVLFGLGEQAPEALSPGRLRWLAVYAWAVWIYRLFLFVGIALLVYAYFFKALGVIMLVAEIGYFIAGPIFSELKAWWARRNALVRAPRAWFTGGFAAGLLVLAIVPWSTTVSVPAIVEPAEVHRLYPARAARVVEVAVSYGAAVSKGQPLVILEAIDLANERRLVLARLALVKVRLARQASDTRDREESLVLLRERDALEGRLAGLAAEAAELVVRAPAAGTIVALDPALAVDRWVSRTTELVAIRSGSRLKARGYLDEDGARRVADGARGHFVPEDVQRTGLVVRLGDMAPAASQSMELPALASPSGGPIAAEPQRDGRLVPMSARFLATFEIAEGGVPGTAIDGRMGVRGTILLDAQPESLLTRTGRQIVKVLLREAGA